MWLCGKSEHDPFKLTWTIQVSSTLHAHLFYISRAFRFDVSWNTYFLPLYLCSISYLQWKNWNIPSFKFPPPLRISTAGTQKDTLQMSTEFLYCLQQQTLQSQKDFHYSLCLGSRFPPAPWFPLSFLLFIFKQHMLSADTMERRALQKCM